MRSRVSLSLGVLLAVAVTSAAQPPAGGKPELPTVVLIGDSIRNADNNDLVGSLSTVTMDQIDRRICRST